MITVRDDTGENEIHLADVSHCENQEQAAMLLCDSLSQATQLFGGQAHMIYPGNPHYPDSHGVLWQGGPSQWADAYVVCEGAIGPAFTAEAAAGQAVIFTNVDS